MDKKNDVGVAKFLSLMGILFLGIIAVVIVSLML
jgi:hypothetical protein